MTHMAALNVTKSGTLSHSKSKRIPFKSPSFVVKASINIEKEADETPKNDNSRRSALLALTAAAISTTTFPVSQSWAKGGASTRVAGDFCPPSKDGFVRYTPVARATPSLRAGVITDLYSFDLPPNWSEGTILNILSGNFCMPRCDEPWYETLWESKDEGTATLVVSPLYRLISKTNATLKDLGSPDQVVERIGAFITGNYLDSVEDVVTSSTEQFDDGNTYFTYELNAPYAKTGSHLLAAFTVKGNLAYLWVLAASDKQWPKSEGKLRSMLKSFKVSSV